VINLLSEFTIVYIMRGDAYAPPYVATTRDQDEAERQALEWAQSTFGPGDYRTVGGQMVSAMQGRRWGDEIPRP
jgi:hypothetical protein